MCKITVSANDSVRLQTAPTKWDQFIIRLLVLQFYDAVPDTSQSNQRVHPRILKEVVNRQHLMFFAQ